MTTTFTYAELLTMRQALDHLAAEPSPIAYPIARNLSRIGSVINEIESTRKTIIERVAKRNDAGEMVRQVVDRTGRFVSDYHEGQAVEAENMVVASIAEEHQEGAKQALEELNRDRHPVDLYTISVAKVEALVVPAWTLAALLDTIIVESTQEDA
jgi:hypothetical protein